MTGLWSLFGEFNEGHFFFLADWSAGMLGALGGGVLLVLVLSFLDLREMRPRWRAHLLLGLRTLVFVVAGGLLLEPALELRDVERERNHVVVLVDASRSMEVRTPLGPPRASLAAAMMTTLAPVAQAHSDGHIFDIFTFGEDATRRSFAEVQGGAVAERAEETRIRESLESALSQIGDGALGGVLLVSDGLDRGVLGGRTEEGEELDMETLEFLSGLDAPVHVFAASASEGVRDVAIEQVLHDDFAFVRNRVVFDVTLHGVGLAGRGVQIELRENGRRIRTQQVGFTSADARETFSFEVVPDALGTYVYSVIVEPLDGEAIEENNRAHFALSVIRDKIRVLQVCGRPSWDERFLRRLLKENPNVDLISFFILRTNSDLQLVPEEELSLIPFPKEELFDQELPGFDLVIFQNFNFGPYVFHRYLSRVAEFVEGGGGFLMLGGDLSFSSGGYHSTPIADLLPVELYPQSASGGLISTELFRPEVSVAGWRHPITKLAFDGEENARLWQGLPLLEGTNIVRGLRPGAVALVHHPSLRAADGSAMPVVAVAEVGEGRSMSFTTDSSWLWSFVHTGAGGTARPFTNFWNNAMRWLIKDPELKLLKVNVVEQVQPGQQVEATIEVLAPDYAPEVGAHGRVSLVRQSLTGEWSAGSVDVVRELSFETDATGRYVLSFTPEEEGVYRIQAEVRRDGKTLNDEDLLLVARGSDELREIAPHNETLRRIAEASGGVFEVLPLAEGALDELSLKPPRVTRINRRRLVTLWDAWWVFAVLSVLLAGEWLLRRRWGRI